MTDETANTPIEEAAENTADTTAELAATAVIPTAPPAADENTAMNKLDFHPTSVEDELPHKVLPYTMILGRKIDTDIYNVIYAILAIITLTEVAIAEIFEPSFILRVPLLAGLSITKALLVVAFYMHLREDSRVFAAAIIFPTLVSLVCTLFLLSVPYSTYTPAP